MAMISRYLHADSSIIQGMEEQDPIKARFGNDEAPTLANDAEELNKQEIRNREKDRTTQRAIDDVPEDPFMDNPFRVQG